ncbi:hypothetical protein QQF64_013550, partial [Cirrhinus molitorella]
LAQYMPRFLQMFRAKMSSMSQLESLLSKINSNEFHVNEWLLFFRAFHITSVRIHQISSQQ